MTALWISALLAVQGVPMPPILSPVSVLVRRFRLRRSFDDIMISEITIWFVHDFTQSNGSSSSSVSSICSDSKSSGGTGSQNRDGNSCRS